MRAITAFALLTMLVACDNATPTKAISAETAAAEGFYGLVSVNDTLLPRTVSTATNYLLEITSDTIVLVSDGRWVDITHYRETDGATVTLLDNSIGGTFEVSQSTITFSSPGGNDFAGVLQNGTLTINLGAKAVYRK